MTKFGKLLVRLFCLSELCESLTDSVKGDSYILCTLLNNIMHNIVVYCDIVIFTCVIFIKCDEWLIYVVIVVYVNQRI